MPDPSPKPIHYTVRSPAADPHYVDIEAQIPLHEEDAGKCEVELFLPVWTPGSYLVREYARHVECLTALSVSQEVLTTVKIRKNRWLLRSATPLHEINISYRLYCNDLTVRTNFRDESLALLHGAATFITLTNGLAYAYEVTLEPTPQWSGSWSGMTGTGNTFSAPDYDCLVDSPLVAGNPAIHTFMVDGKPHTLLSFGDSSAWDFAQAVPDIEKIVLQNRAVWSELPYDRYLFINLLTGGRGALEHRNSMVLMADRFTMRTRSSYRNWLELVSHEFFHVWNAKRLRPVELGPFDYENEVYTRNLWITEGFTEYYGPLTVCRSNLSTVDEFLGTDSPPRQRGGPDSLSGWIEELQNTPGRLRQPVATASFDAWIKLYRPDENSLNSSISYYTKGAVIAWLLDAKIRAATNGVQTLDDLMRLAFQRYSGPRGFSTEEFIDTAQCVVGSNLNNWFVMVTETTEELDYGEALSWFGLRFKMAAEAPTPKAWLGLTVKTDAHRLIVGEVPFGTIAYEAGIQPADEILAINNHRVLPEQWNSTMERYREGEGVLLLVSRRDRLLTVSVRMGQEPARRWVIEIDPDATDSQRQHLTAWLGLERTRLSPHLP